MLSKTRLIAKITPFTSRFIAVSHPFRAAILYLLSENEEMEIWELSGRIGISSSLISHHIKMLFQHQWINKMRVGKRVFYRLDEKAKEFMNTFFVRK